MKGGLTPPSLKQAALSPLSPQTTTKTPLINQTPPKTRHPLGTRLAATQHVAVSQEQLVRRVTKLISPVVAIRLTTQQELPFKGRLRILMQR